jgi:hypothetical protein
MTLYSVLILSIQWPFIRGWLNDGHWQCAQMATSVGRDRNTPRHGRIRETYYHCGERGHTPIDSLKQYNVFLNASLDSAANIILERSYLRRVPATTWLEVMHIVIRVIDLMQFLCFCVNTTPHIVHIYTPGWNWGFLSRVLQRQWKVLFHWGSKSVSRILHDLHKRHFRKVGFWTADRGPPMHICHTNT